MVENKSPVRQSLPVGRVGALAAALGVGAAVMGFSGVAAADTGDSAGSTGQESRSADAATSNSKARAGARRSARDGGPRSGATPAPASAVEASRAAAGAASAGNSAANRVRLPGARSGATGVPVRTMGTPLFGIPKSSPEAELLGALLTPGGVQGWLQKQMPTIIGDLFSTIVNAVPSISELTAQVGEIAVAEEPPVMTATAPVGELSVVDDPAALGEDGSGEPGAEPLAWAALAASRREDLAGPTPEVAAAAVVGSAAALNPSVRGANPSVTGFDPVPAVVGETLKLTGANLSTMKYVKFNCSSNSCPTAEIPATVKDRDPNGKWITVIVPANAEDGKYVGVSAALSYTQSSGTLTVAPSKPSITSVTPPTGAYLTPVTINGGLLDGATSVKFGVKTNGIVTTNAGVEAVDFTVNEAGTQITATVPFGVGDGKIIRVTTPKGVADLSGFTYISGPTFENPPLPPGQCQSDSCSLAKNYRGAVQNIIARKVAAALPTAGLAGGCNENTCEISNANYIAAYAFPVIYTLLAGPKDEATGKGYTDAQVGETIAALASQQNILTFISQTVANNFSVLGGKFPILPPAVANTIGNAAATFVLNSFGNTDVATAFVPFLRGLNIPYKGGTAPTPVTAFLANLQSPEIGLKAILSSGEGKNSRAYDPEAMQLGLVENFFGSAAVRNQLGTAVASSIKVLLGLPTTTWPGEPPVGQNAVANFAGGLIAEAVLGSDNPAATALASTVSTALAGLFTAVGPVVATQAGNAFATLLAQPGLDGEAPVGVTLANAIINNLVVFLRGDDINGFPIPFEDQPPLRVALAPAAGVAVTGFVNSLFAPANVETMKSGFSNFVNQLIPGVLANEGIEDLIGQAVSATVSNALGGGAFADSIGDQVGASVGYLLANPTVSDALAAFINTGFGTFFGSEGVVSALATAAGALTTNDPTEVIDDLKVNPAIDAGVNAGVTAAVAGLLGNEAVWTEVDSTVTSLLQTLFFEPSVQDAVAGWVAEKVELRATGELGVFLGKQLGTLVVELLSNPTVSSGLLGVFDTMLSDLFGSPGVVTAVSQAAGTLAEATVYGNLQTVRPEVIAALKANTDVQAGVQLAVADAVYDFLGDSDLWTAVDTTVSAWVIDLTTNPVALAGISSAVSQDVQTRLGEPLGAVVGPQVGAAVASLLSNPVVANALLGAADSLFSDFFGSFGVVPAFSGAAGEFAIALLGGESVAGARKAFGDELKSSPAVDAGLDTAVTATVAQLLGNAALWAEVDTTVSSLATQLLADQVVQEALATQVANEVVRRLGVPFGAVVGAQLGAAVVSLVTNPLVQSLVHDVLDSMWTDFWGSPGVVDAFSQAAGDLAGAWLYGDLDVVGPQVQEALRTDADVQTAAQTAVGDAVGQLLSNAQLWSAVDAELTTFVRDLMSTQAAQTALYDQVSWAVQGALGEPLGSVVGPQVAAAVVSLATNPVVGAALQAVTDTLFSDFFGSFGVVPAFAGAATELTLVLVTGGSWTDGVRAAQEELKTSPAVDAGFDTAVTSAVEQLLGNRALWAEVDTTVSSLAAQLLSDEVVQEALATQVANEVVRRLGVPFGAVVGAQLGAAVVSLLTDPVVQAELFGVVDSVLTDFWTTPGVVEAFSQAAGDLAGAWLYGDLDVVGPQVQEALRADTAVQTAAQAAVGDAVGQLLRNAQLWAKVDTALTTFVKDLLSTQAAQTALYDQVSAMVESAIGGDLGAVVGPQVAMAVVLLATSPVVGSALESLTDTLFTDFFGSFGVVPAVAGAATELTLVLVTGGDWAEATKAAREELATSPAVDAGIDNSVSAAVAQLVNDADLWNVVGDTLGGLVTEVIGDDGVPQYVGGAVKKLVTNALGESPLAGPVGTAVGAAVAQFLAAPGVAADLGAVIGALLPEFFGQDGVADALGQAAGDVVAAGIAGDPVSGAWTTLRANVDFQNAVGATVTDVVEQLIDDAAVVDALGPALGVLVTDLAGNTAVQRFVGTEVTTLVTKAFSASPLTAPIATQVGAAVGATVQQLLSAPGVASALGAVIAAVVPDFLSQSGIGAALGPAAGTLAAAWVAGDDLRMLVPEVLASLETNPAVIAALKATVVDALDLIDTSFLTNPAVQQAIGASVGTFTTDLFSNTVVQNFIGTRLGNPLGGVVVSLLATPGVTAALGQAVGSSVTGFLAYPGFITVVTGAIEQFAGAVLDGEPRGQALQTALLALQANPVFQGAVAAVIPGAVDLFLGNPDVAKAVGAATKTLISDYLRNNVINNRLLDGAAGRVVGGTVDALLGQPSVIDLINSLAVDVLDGMPLSDVSKVVVHEILYDPSLQAAIGLSIGAGVGDLLGDNIVGFLVGQFVGIGAAIVVSLAAGIYKIVSGGGPDLPASAGPAAAAVADGYLDPVFGDPYAMAVAVEDGFDAASLVGTLGTDARFSLGEFAVAGLGRPERANFLDVSMSVEDGGEPLAVAFRFRLDSLFTQHAPMVFGVADRRTPQPVA